MSEIEIQLKKGVLGLCVLALLSRGDSYAYEIASRLPKALGNGNLSRSGLANHGVGPVFGVAAAAAVARFHEGADVRTVFASNQEVDRVLRGIEARPGEDLWVTDISWTDPETEAHLRSLAERAKSTDLDPIDTSVGGVE